MKICPMGPSCSLWTDRQMELRAGMKKLRVVSRNFANVSKNCMFNVNWEYPTRSAYKL